MAVNKILEIDLTQLTQDSAKNLVNQFDDIIQETTKANKQAQKTKKKLPKKKGKDISSKESFEDFTDVLSGSKGINFFVQQFKTAIPFITPILLATGFFVSQLLKLDKLNKKFLDIANTRISVFIKRQQQALLDSRQIQTIYTTKAGIASPRDSYNSFNESDRSIINNGVDRDASTNGGID